ncbi:MAG: hypothetical protein LC725_00620 [Lentisphaerae bacterium]|nr:hypothetical protein [Lentisphaerota bacterium]
MWHVLHLRPRCEKKMRTYLDGLSLTNYLPLASVTRIYQRRKVVFENPLFPGYIFAFFNPDQRLSILKSPMLVRIIPVPNQAQLIYELDQLKAALAENPFLKARPGIARGDRVRITAGPLRGIEGIIQIMKGSSQVVLSVDAIGQGVAVEVAMDALETI